MQPLQGADLTTNQVTVDDPNSRCQPSLSKPVNKDNKAVQCSSSWKLKAQREAVVEVPAAETPAQPSCSKKHPNYDLLSYQC